MSIVHSDGSEFNLDNVQPELIGYQIVHNITGRILPGTTRQEMYSMAAGIRKMNQVASMYTVMQCSLDIWDYELCPMYDIECPKNYIYISDKDDTLFT